MPTRSLFFDRQDRELLSMINHALDQGGGQGDTERKAFNTILHPHGILELATSHAERMALAVINLLGSLEAGQAEDRLVALRTLHDEVLHSAQTTFRYNTGRVLIQIMKEIVRSQDDNIRQLMLAHDFRLASAGNPRVVRRFLKQHHLLEMPESWNQLAMDHHVHDANTKGRKNPTHLIMDAWIKGLRFLTVIYYNYVTPEAVRELMHAAEIMDVSLRIGLEFRVPFHGRCTSIIWVPRSFADAESLTAFLAENGVQALMQEGRRASDWAAAQVLCTLEHWNTELRPLINAKLDLDLPPLPTARFLQFVGTGQASYLHLAEMLHRWMLPALQQRFASLSEEVNALTAACDTDRDNPLLSDAARAERLAALRQRMSYLDSLTPEAVLHTWLTTPGQPELPYPLREVEAAPADSSAPPPIPVPELLTLAPHTLVDWLVSLRSASHIWLNLAGLTPEDVLELLWDCKGSITHLEIFNLKEWQEGSTPHLDSISRVQQGINEGSALHLKQLIRTMVHKAESSGEGSERCEKLRIILRNIRTLQGPYKLAPLRSRIGTDSTSNSNIRHGMGLVLPDTLPRRTRRQLDHDTSHIRVPVHLTIFPRVSFLPPRRRSPMMTRMLGLVRCLPGMQRVGLVRKWEWLVYSDTARVCTPQETADAGHTRGEDCTQGNVVTMGGIGGIADNGFATHAHIRPSALPPGWARWRYLNTPLTNTIKVALGFITAMGTFLYTQDWWVLAWYGAAIWFAITALRNVIQAVLSGGGIIHTSLLRWNDYINGTRVCDSLMYTGFSVLLLEYGIRVLLLQSLMGVTVSNNPALVFSCMAIANGLYIAAHNVYRGFPTEAIIGNLFRSILAIPCAMLYHDGIIIVMTMFGVFDPLVYMQLGAAIVSKSASDTVAAVIEGFADRHNSLRLRFWDYRTKLVQLFDNYVRMELAYPESDILHLLSRPKSLLRFTEETGKTLQVTAIINALDLMYFWHYQPRAQQAIKNLLRFMTAEERLILSRSQLVLMRVREVSQLFVNGLVGDHFAKALAFYLDRHEEYIRLMHAACAQARQRKNIRTQDSEDDDNDVSDAPLMPNLVCELAAPAAPSLGQHAGTCGPDQEHPPLPEQSRHAE